ncbi:hypothetical protein BBBOND_0101280 [Babesia bigemina]|uniref:Uncharacterized protein n=1 Tax=Babesia bigemina TaxID=5866 RepID=A0A061D4E5_BABBI|nr:hypothetical protein BBBOND_0101280 [Babesia bigemina]CDR93799.1 hypothetical protein BBBOND_0101280 [Babesia bigemina]|eukprot:XP_012765985.1 hypothetical protein BBBOND_0101280 [Babesia bigemina]
MVLPRIDVKFAFLSSVSPACHHMWYGAKRQVEWAIAVMANRIDNGTAWNLHKYWREAVAPQNPKPALGT